MTSVYDHGTRMNTTTVKPGIGVGDVHLHAAASEILALLGRPDSMEGEEWTYGALEMTLRFSESRLVAIEAYSDAVEIGGTAIGDKKQNELVPFLESLGWGKGVWENGDLKFANGVSVAFHEGQFDDITIAALA